MKKLITILFSLLSLFVIGQAGDCPGLCVTSGNSYTAVNGAIDNELNSSNDGCLTALEATSSYWFQVCFTSNGTFYMSMDPSGNKNDFDWAIWNGSNCPPTNNPIRCSWAGIFPFGGASNGLTGLGNGATDFTEGASGNGWLAPINVTNGQCLTIGINNYGNGSNDFSINFNNTTASLYCPLTLPIELLSFSVENVDNENVVNWVTASERDNDYFTIEHSSDGYNWNSIGKIDGGGTNNSGNMYVYIHEDFYMGVNYYRLKQTDYNGESETFEIISIDNSIKQKEIMKVYNMMGQEVNLEYIGLKIIIYSDGSTKKLF